MGTCAFSAQPYLVAVSNVETLSVPILDGVARLGEGNPSQWKGLSFTPSRCLWTTPFGVSGYSRCVHFELRAGDLGWLDRDPAKNRKVPAAVVRAAFFLAVGQVSDLVSSERGIHLILRTA